MVAGSACVGGAAGFASAAGCSCWCCSCCFCCLMAFAGIGGASAVGVAGAANAAGPLAVGGSPMLLVLLLVHALVLLASSCSIGIQSRSLCLALSRPIRSRDFEPRNMPLC